MELLAKAICIAAEAHSNQKDKAGEPYILHPLRVMMTVDSIEAKMVAVLHDVVEDSPWSIADLAANGFHPSVQEAVEHITKRDGEDYTKFVARVAKNDLAREVKLADLRDNMNLSRLEEVTDKDLKRLKKYHNAWMTLVTPNA